MMRWEDQKEVGSNRGGLVVGQGWNTEGQYGITDSERLALRGFALEYKDLTEADGGACNRANLILWRNQQEVGDE